VDGISGRDLWRLLEKYMNEEISQEKSTLQRKNLLSEEKNQRNPQEQRGGEQSNQNDQRELNGSLEKIIVIPRNVLADLERFLNLNQPLLFKFLVKRIRKSILDNSDETLLFYLGDMRNAAIVRQKDYIRVLSDALAFFIKTEEYEWAGRCKTVLEKYSIEQVINGANSKDV